MLVSGRAIFFVDGRASSEAGVGECCRWRSGRCPRGRAADREDKRPGMVKPGTGAATVRVGMLQALPVSATGAHSPARRNNCGKCS
jgi:hypothetical protein